MKGFFLDITGIKPGGKSLTRTARCAHLYQYKVKRKILNEDYPPRRRYGSHLWIGTVCIVSGYMDLPGHRMDHPKDRGQVSAMSLFRADLYVIRFSRPVGVTATRQIG
jgi:hypothetical protein